MPSPGKEVPPAKLTALVERLREAGFKEISQSIEQTKEKKSDR